MTPPAWQGRSTVCTLRCAHSLSAITHELGTVDVRLQGMALWAVASARTFVLALESHHGLFLSWHENVARLA